jgi:hypothetical protein
MKDLPQSTVSASQSGQNPDRGMRGFRRVGVWERRDGVNRGDAACSLSRNNGRIDFPGELKTLQAGAGAPVHRSSEKSISDVVLARRLPFRARSGLSYWGLNGP